MAMGSFQIQIDLGVIILFEWFCGLGYFVLFDMGIRGYVFFIGDFRDN